MPSSKPPSRLDKFSLLWTIFLILCVLVQAIQAIGEIRKGQLSFLGGLALFTIGALIILIILILIYPLLHRLPHKPGYKITFPGVEAQRTRMESVDTNFPTSSKIQNSSNNLTVSCIVEGTRLESLEEARWRLYLYFTIFNFETQKIIVYDMHANAYVMDATSPFLLPQWNMEAKREWIELYQDNSLLASGNYYELAPNEYLPIVLTLEITRLTGEKFENGVLVERNPESGSALSIFGLFVDYHYLKEGRVGNMRMPSDSLFLFQHDTIGQLIFINKKNIAHYLEKHNGNHTAVGILKIVKDLLEKHTSQKLELSG